MNNVCEVRVSPDVFEWLKGVDLNAVPKLPKVTIGGDFYPLRNERFQDFTEYREPNLFEILRGRFDFYINDRLRLNAYGRSQFSPKMAAALFTMVGWSTDLDSDGLPFVRLRRDGAKAPTTYWRGFWERA